MTFFCHISVNNGQIKKARLGVWDWYVHTAVFKTGDQQWTTLKKKKCHSPAKNNIKINKQTIKRLKEKKYW